MPSSVEDIVKLKIRVGIFLLAIGILFIFFSGLGVINFATATVELGPSIRVINSSPGVILIIIGWLIMRSIKVTKEVKTKNGMLEKIIAFKKR